MTAGLCHSAFFSHPLVRLAWCLIGVGTALALTLRVVAPPHAPFLLASLGGTAVFLFGLTRAPAAQPRALVGGHLGGAVIGIACQQVFGDATVAYAVAITLTLAFMLITRTVHPPAGANPLLMIAANAQWPALVHPLLTGVVMLMGLAMIWSRLFPGLSHYPVEMLAPSPPRPDWGGWGN